MLRRNGVKVAVTVILLACLIGALGRLSTRAANAQDPSQTPESKPFDVASDPDFKNYRKVVTRFADEHRPKKTNNFCIIGLSTEGSRSAWVLWREGGEIILWEGGDNLNLSRRVIHLKSDVVATDADLHGSTYLVTRSWVDRLSKNCKSFGVKVRTGTVIDSTKP